MPYLSTFALVKSRKECAFTLVYTYCLKNVLMNNNQKQERKEKCKDIIQLCFPVML